MFSSTRPSTPIASTPFCAAPSSPFAFLPSRTTFLRSFFAPLMIRSSKLFFFRVPSRTTPSTYLPGRIATIAFTLRLAFLPLNEPAASTAFWIVRYRQPCLQTSKVFAFACCFFFPPPLPASAGAARVPSRAHSPRTRRGTASLCFISLLAASCFLRPCLPAGTARRSPKPAKSSLAEPGRSARNDLPHRFVEFRHAKGALDAVADDSVLVDQERPGLGFEVEGLNLGPRPLGDFVVVPDLHVDEVGLALVGVRHLLGDVDHRAADAALAERRGGEDEHDRLLADRVGEVDFVHLVGRDAGVDLRHVAADVGGGRG